MTYYPQKPTNWSENLSKVYHRQSQQLAEHHANLRERDRQLVEKAQNESIVKVMEQLADFIPKAMALKDKVSTAIDTKREQNYKSKSNEEKQAIRIRYKTDTLDLNKREDAIRNELKKLDYTGDKQQELYEQIVSLSPGTLHRNAVYAAKDAVQYLTTEAMLDDNEGDVKWTQRYDAADSLNRAEMHRDYIDKKLQPFQMSDGHWGDTVSDEIDRIVGVTSGTKKAKTKSLKLSSRASEFKTTLSPLVKIGNDPYHAIEHVRKTILDRAVPLSEVNGKTAIQQATESVVKDLYDMGQAGVLDRDMLNKLVTGELNHPAGKDLPSAFFDKDGAMENHLLKAVEQGEALKYEQAKAIDTAEFQSNYLKFKTDNSDTKAINEYIAKVSVSTLDGKSAKIELLEDLRDNDQSPAAAQQIIKTYSNIRNNGDLDTKIEELKELKNVEAKGVLLEEAEQLKDAKEQTNFKKQLTSNTDQVNKVRTEKTFGQGKPTKLAGWVSKDLNRFQSQDFAKRVRNAYTISKGQPIDLDKISLDNYNATQAYWKSNGGGLTQDESAGKFAVDADSGDYQNYGKYLDILSRTDNEHNVPINLAKWHDDNNSTRELYQTNGVYNPELRYNTPNAIFTKDGIAGILQNGYFNAKQLTIAKLEGYGDNPSKLLEHAIEALKKGSKEDKAYAELLNLDSVDPKNNPDSILKTKLDEAFSNVNTESVNDTTFALNIKHKLKYKGYGDFSQNDYKQLFLFLNQSGISQEQFDEATKQMEEILFKQDAAEFGETEAGVAMNELGNK